MDKIHTKQKVFGLKGDSLEPTNWCAPDEATAIGEYDK